MRGNQNLPENSSKSCEFAELDVWMCILNVTQTKVHTGMHRQPERQREVICQNIIVVVKPCFGKLLRAWQVGESLGYSKKGSLLYIY